MDRRRSLLDSTAEQSIRAYISWRRKHNVTPADTLAMTVVRSEEEWFAAHTEDRNTWVFGKDAAALADVLRELVNDLPESFEPRPRVVRFTGEIDEQFVL